VDLTHKLKEAECEVPDILVMTMCNHHGQDSAVAKRCAEMMPADARMLVRTATVGSEPPLLTPLPHTQAIARLQAAKRVVPEVCPACISRFLHIKYTMPALKSLGPLL
jgi:hypothetical protein